MKMLLRNLSAAGLHISGSLVAVEPVVGADIHESQLSSRENLLHRQLKEANRDVGTRFESRGNQVTVSW